MVEIKRDIPAEEVFRYMKGLDLPFLYGADFDTYGPRPIWTTWTGRGAGCFPGSPRRGRI